MRVKCLSECIIICVVFAHYYAMCASALQVCLQI